MVLLYAIMARIQLSIKDREPQKLQKPLKLQKPKESHTATIKSILGG